MNAQTVNIDPAVIRQATAVMKRQGMSMDDTLKVFYRQICLHDKLPIENKIPNAETKQALQDFKAGRNITKYNSVDELMKDISC